MRLAAFLKRQALRSTLRSPTETEKPPSSPIRTTPNCLARPSAGRVFARALIHSLLGGLPTPRERPLPTSRLPCLLFLG
jgi:hypothetical protein